ncbi:MAG: bifunctional glutamate N-acetyltransferase/amino-acid acetyltransferase ArgJ [Clostridiales bacterium]|nr:bifunctional glutamate N-acetyltransferase/amino-acid acetyltransferase ArgJ [Clostridiales bacterium]
MDIEYINGGVCAPQGFKAAGIACGFKSKGKKDLALIVSDVMCTVAAVYTTNKVKGAPLAVTKKNISDGLAKAIICNSGNANTCAPGGIAVAEKTCRLTGKLLGTEAENIIVCSTGVIGQRLEFDRFEKGIPMATAALKGNGCADAAQAIMTTDTVSKMVAVELVLGGKKCRIGGIAKGSGMINPKMATMLAFITTDAAITSEALDKALKEDIRSSFNQICIDGDTSTNDMAVVMANGMASNPTIKGEGEDMERFKRALSMVTVFLAKQLARDGEGASKLIECNVCGAPTHEVAGAIGKSVIASDLFKTAVFGSDANWGRALCAIGYTEGDFSVDNIDVTMSSTKGQVCVCRCSQHEEYSEEAATAILGENEIVIDINMNQGCGQGTAWGCDLTYDYVKINGDYRS